MNTQNQNTQKFYVGKLSDQVQSNYMAWVQVIPEDPEFDTLEDAKKFAEKLLNEDYDKLPEGCSVLGYSYVIHDGEELF